MSYQYSLRRYGYAEKGVEEANEPVRFTGAQEANEHGLTSYRRGCRCEECRTAKSADARQYRERLKDQM